MTYADFLAQKAIVYKPQGKAVPGPVHPKLFDFQKALVEWAVHKGRCAIFADTGLGKTLMQLEWARLMNVRTIILAPLAVAPQTIAEGKKIGIDVTYARSQEQATRQITITNYEMQEHFDTTKFEAVVLDESSILKSYMGKTKQELIKAFSRTPYRLCCTATPSPNDLLEIGNHSEFLGVMNSNEMISRWFINNAMEAGDYRLKKHAEADFWRWLSSWAMTVSKPSDLGFKDAGFNLPPLNIIEHMVNANVPLPPGMMFDVSTPSATGLHRIKRHSASERALKVQELVKAQGTWIVWCDTNYEADALVELIPEAVEVRGSESLAAKEMKLAEFSQGHHRVIITKPEIAGFGLNWQHCHQVVFAGVNYSFERFYQAVRRSWRFGQPYPVDVHIILTPQEQGIRASVVSKEESFQQMKAGVVKAVKEAQMDELYGKRGLSPSPAPEYTDGDGWRMWTGDSVEVMKQLADNSVDLTITSPPFSNLYIYSDALADMGNSASDDVFFKHFSYVITELHRVTVPGRLAVIHCKDLPLYKGRDGAAGLKDFPGAIICAFEDCGWTYHSRVTIWKDPVTEMQRTKNHGLLHKQLCKDSCASRQGMADYLVVFRKWNESAEFPKPVNIGTSERRFETYIGEDTVKANSLRDYSIQVWQRYASPVWWDINQMNVLNKVAAKESKDEKHICPLQLDVIARSISLWSNHGDMVFDPFAGIGSTGFEAVKAGRKFTGIELKPAYVAVACKNLAFATTQKTQQSLFEVDTCE